MWNRAKGPRPTVPTVPDAPRLWNARPVSHSAMEGAKILRTDFGHNLFPKCGSYGCTTFETDRGTFVVSHAYGELTFYRIEART